MAKDSSSDEGDGAAELRAQFADLIGRLDRQNSHQLGSQLVSSGSMPDPVALDAGPPPCRRRSRRTEEVTYRLRVDLTGAQPPIWRRLELSSQMPLDELHLVIQSTFGWTDSHLHRFGSGTSVWDRTCEVYLCPFDVDEGEDEHGIPEDEVRLDEVLVDVGERLHYVYDYGDDWQHVVRLEAVLARPADAPRGWCTDGGRDAPPEDCGGIAGYQELVAAGEIDDGDLDLEEVNDVLSAALEFAETVATVSGDAGALLRQLKGHHVELELASLLRDARLREPVLVDLADATGMVARYTWLLERVGDEGIRLTSAGYLPPRDVDAAWTELKLSDEWIGKGTREVQVRPLLELRQSARTMGLLRKYRGWLLLTKAGQRLRHDPVGLWWHLASHLASGGPGIEDHARLVTMVGVAAGQDIAADDFRRLRTDVLGALGWRLAGGAPLREWDGAAAARGTVHVLRQLGALLDGGMSATSHLATAGGRALCRAALRGVR